MIFVVVFFSLYFNKMVLSFRTDSPLQTSDPDRTAQGSSLMRVYTVCHSICTFWTNFSIDRLLSLNFNMIQQNILGVLKFKDFYGNPYCFQVHSDI